MKTLTRPTITTTGATAMPTTVAAAPPDTPTLAEAVALASIAVLDLGVDDPRWGHVGPALTAFVDAARRAVDGSGSRIGSDEAAMPALRLRDLGRLAQMTATTHHSQPVEVAQRLRSLQTATHQ